MAEHKFKEGTRVALCHGRSHKDAYYTEDFVAKVYKNGNFILKGDAHKKQWSAWSDGVSAHRTGDYSFGGRQQLRIWDETTDAEITAANERQKRVDRIWNVKRKVEHMRIEHVTDEALEAFEAAIGKLNGDP